MRAAIATLLFIIALLVLAITPGYAASPSMSDSPAAVAAGGVLAYITGVDLEIAKCREIDPRNAASYDLTFGLYHREIAAIIAAVTLILQQEAIRAGAPSDAFIKQMAPVNELANQEIARLLTVNPGGFMGMCHSLAESFRRRIGPFQSLREQLPDDMKKVDEWR